MRTKEELNALKTEVEAMNKKLQDLTEEELKQVVGGKVGSGNPDVDMSIENESIPVNPGGTCPRCKIGCMQTVSDNVTKKPLYLTCSNLRCCYIYTPLIGFMYLTIN